jgi:hypothetical protein
MKQETTNWRGRITLRCVFWYIRRVLKEVWWLPHWKVEVDNGRRCRIEVENDFEARIARLEELVLRQSGIGLDVSPRSGNTIMILFSRVGGGQIRFIPTTIQSLQDFEHEYRMLRERYGLPGSPYVDENPMNPVVSRYLEEHEV